ncbi:putative beta-lactamase [Rhizobium sp. PDO1-076]|uniref:MBL fold metallo-hydrolase n=1 Tax=Rhizobium sp. PDO1-076 TaxID=1125979 RepID=UPI00024E33F9|nr:MBL fold metallo-hydrolase [Rhizobium sp. PDO1-076]EHS52793.1 putative beta-lactamase [Rhizobium sp. PDO1-076]
MLGRPHTFVLIISLTIATTLPAVSHAEDASKKLPTEEELANDNQLFINLARKALKWDEPTEPFRMVGPLYFVGTKGLSSFLFSTSEGLILLNTSMPETGDLVLQSIRKLGFSPEDIKIIINGHAHSDHAGAFAQVKQLSGAKLAVMEADVGPMQDGGKSDFHYGDDRKIMGFPPVKVDRILRDGDTVRLGELVLTGYNTPGHKRGSTTWVKQPSYPGIEVDYRNTHHVLEMLKPDIWAGHHTEYFDMENKRKRAETEGVAAWVDPEGYRRFVAEKKHAFEALVDKEMGVSAQPAP